MNKSWRKCKLLGSYLDTIEDIRRRKSLALNNITENNHVYTNKNLSISLKIRYFKIFTESIFRYHSELWTTTKTINDQIDSFSPPTPSLRAWHPISGHNIKLSTVQHDQVNHGAEPSRDAVCHGLVTSCEWTQKHQPECPLWKP